MAGTSALDLQSPLELGLRLHRSGRLSEAAFAYRAVLSADPAHPEANHLLGLIAYQRGNYGESIELIRKAVARDPSFAPFHLNLGNSLQSAGDLTEAAECFRTAFALEPRLSISIFNLANALERAGDRDGAIREYRRYLSAAPGHAEARYNLGLALKAAGDLPGAEAELRRAIELRPKMVDAYSQLGLTLLALGHTAEAIENHEKSVSLDPERADAHYLLGLAYLADQNNHKAVRSLKRAIRVDPTVPEVYLKLGEALGRIKRFPDAVTALEVARRLRPHYRDAEYVEVCLRTANEYITEDEAEQIVQQCMEWPAPGPIVTVACNLILGGRKQQGMKLAEWAESLDLAPGERVKLAMCLPSILDSEEEIDYWRQRFESKVQHLMDLGVKLSDPLRQIGKTNFFLAYHSRNDRDLQEKVARFYSEACPALGFVADHCANGRRERSGRIKIGFVSYHLRQHTIGKLNRGLISQLDRTRFHVTVFQIGPVSTKEDDLARRIAESADCSERLEGDTFTMQAAIARHELDVLFYTDIGMDPFTYFLAFARLAPVQCVTWGHPVTTGIPTVDYFISSRDLDAEDAQEHYTETLFRPDVHPVHYYLPETPEREHGTLLKEHRNCRLYVCVQSLFKLHPDFDRVLARILRLDPDGKLVFIRGAEAHMEHQLTDRFRRTMPEVTDRIVFVPRLNTARFVELLGTADVLLDTPYFGGGNTSYEAFAIGAPVVTMERPLMRERITPVLYRQMGFTDLIATNEEDYAQLAVQCATDQTRRNRARDAILAARTRLFQVSDGIRELEAFLERAVANTGITNRTTKKPAHTADTVESRATSGG